nr:pescadillo homolog [Ipomoea batatas]
MFNAAIFSCDDSLGVMMSDSGNKKRERITLADLFSAETNTGGAAQQDHVILVKSSAAGHGGVGEHATAKPPPLPASSLPTKTGISFAKKIIPKLVGDRRPRRPINKLHQDILTGATSPHQHRTFGTHSTESDLFEDMLLQTSSPSSLFQCFLSKYAAISGLKGADMEPWIMIARIVEGDDERLVVIGDLGKDAAAIGCDGLSAGVVVGALGALETAGEVMDALHFILDVQFDGDKQKTKPPSIVACWVVAFMAISTSRMFGGIPNSTDNHMDPSVSMVSPVNPTSGVLIGYPPSGVELILGREPNFVNTSRYTSRWHLLPGV